ncbi:hypothetical protein DCCM_4902 [Desulfocucumis palustris]|uniref:Uncharacterized protein n=1 Tax=Desulfocucumis palustris TaxID=1898651 RepID=A0A2L2XHC6_9FIRM|nr:hypothetical protein DCCM_4902 [Desulfocucumis palustris]
MFYFVNMRCNIWNRKNKIPKNYRPLKPKEKFLKALKN